MLGMRSTKKPYRRVMAGHLVMVGHSEVQATDVIMVYSMGPKSGLLEHLIFFTD